MVTTRGQSDQFELIAVNTALTLWLRLAVLSAHDSGDPDSLIARGDPQWLGHSPSGHHFKGVELALYVNHPQERDVQRKAAQQLTMHLERHPLEPSRPLLKILGITANLVSFFSLYFSLIFAVWCLIANRCTHRVLAWSEVVYPFHYKLYSGGIS